MLWDFNKKGKNAMAKIINTLHKTQLSIQAAMNEELDKVVLSSKFEEMIEDSPGDLSARYWLMQFLEPLNRKELKSVVDGFLIQLLNEEQAKKLVKFLLVRFPQYNNEEMQRTQQDEDVTAPINADEMRV
jgi:hypothetical protein